MNDYAYFYARGYYDGRALGTQAIDFDSLTHSERIVYKRGYDTGVADFGAFDTAEVE